jgi:hypothetical protein
MESSRFRVCTICRKDIGFGTEYFRCSVSTCNVGKLPQYFCSLDCFTAHVPTMRHRDAWAEKTRAPPRPSAAEVIDDETGEVTKLAGKLDADAETHEKEILVVVSKLKAYVRAVSGMSTSDGVLPVLSDLLRRSCDAAIRRARADGRKTVMDRDFEMPS